VRKRIPYSEQRRDGFDVLEFAAENVLYGTPHGGWHFGFEDEADSDSQFTEEDEGEDGDASPSATDEEDERPAATGLSLSALIGSRAPAVLLRLERTAEGVAVRRCASPTTGPAREALSLLEGFVVRRFDRARAGLSAAEWDELLGAAPATLTRRMTLLLRLAADAGEEVALGEDSKAAFTPHDVGLERFAGKFAALPDGTPFSLRLLLLDKRGRKGGEGYFDRLPDAVRLLALRKALARERQQGRAVEDHDFCPSIQKALEELLGFRIERPTDDQVRRRLRDNFKRRGLAPPFRNKTERQQSYNEEAARSKAPEQQPQAPDPAAATADAAAAAPAEERP
jgi:hypothetical protein